MWVLLNENEEKGSMKIEKWINCWEKLTVLFEILKTLQLKYADFPTKAVTLFGILVSKYGSFHFGFKNELNGGCVLLSVNVLYPSRGRWTVLAKPIFNYGEELTKGREKNMGELNQY